VVVVVVAIKVFFFRIKYFNIENKCVCLFLVVINRKVYILAEPLRTMENKKLPNKKLENNTLGNPSGEELVQIINQVKNELSKNINASLDFTEKIYDFSEQLREKYGNIERVEAYHALIGSTYKKEQVVQEHPANKDISEFIKKYS